MEYGVVNVIHDMDTKRSDRWMVDYVHAYEEGGDEVSEDFIDSMRRLGRIRDEVIENGMAYILDDMGHGKLNKLFKTVGVKWQDVVKSVYARKAKGRAGSVNVEYDGRLEWVTFTLWPTKWDNHRIVVTIFLFPDMPISVVSRDFAYNKRQQAYSSQQIADFNNDLEDYADKVKWHDDKGARVLTAEVQFDDLVEVLDHLGVDYEKVDKIGYAV